MDLLQTIILAITQGITELLPISSSGHLIIAANLLDIDVKNIDLMLLTTLHLGTSLAILLFFWKRLWKLITQWNWKFIINIIIASIPAVIAGLLLKDTINTLIDNSEMITIIIAFNLIIWGIVMIIIENLKLKKKLIKKVEDIKPYQALVMGIMQTLALIPGTSRSGVTTIGGIISGIEKYTALQFSFILGLPILFGSFFYEMYLYEEPISTVFSFNGNIAIILAFVIGYISIVVLEKFSKKKFLTFFGVYRIVVGVVLLVMQSGIL